MSVNYLDVIGTYYTDAEAYCDADPTVYSDIQWITTPISQAELDSVHLTEYKTNKLIYFSELAEEDIISGFDSDALGAPHFYESLPEDQLNLVGCVATEMDMQYACWAYINASQVVNVGGAKTGTDSTGFSNDGTTYDCEIVIDGTSTYLSIAGQDAQTYNDLITAINNDIDFSAKGYASLTNGDIIIYSNTYGPSSTVNIVDADLFNQLMGYVTIETASPGQDKSDSTKDYRWHTHAELVAVTQAGADVKLNVLQKYNVKKQQILNAVDIAAVDAITWD